MGDMIGEGIRQNLETFKRQKTRHNFWKRHNLKDINLYISIQLNLNSNHEQID